MLKQNATSVPADETLAPFREHALHLFVRDKVLREQLSVILALLGFINLKVHNTEGGYLDNVRRLAALLVQHEGVFLLSPPLVVYGQGGMARVKKEFTDFFDDLSLVLSKSRKESVKNISKCVPVFADIQLTQKREMIIAGMVRYGVTGCFILKPQEPLRGLNPNFYRVRMKEQIMERVEEIRAYLAEYLPHQEGALEELMQKREELELSERKSEADAWMGKGNKAKSQGNFDQAIECFKKAIDLFPQDPEAYLESGRVYVHVKQYPKALLRFSQAEELAENIPEPNKEIAMVKVLQARDRIAKGESPTSPGIMELLAEALEHFQTALTKAENVQARRDENGALGGSETVSRIASEIVKLDLKTVLGKNHPMVKRMGDLARESFKKIASLQPDCPATTADPLSGCRGHGRPEFLRGRGAFLQGGGIPGRVQRGLQRDYPHGYHCPQASGRIPSRDNIQTVARTRPPLIRPRFSTIWRSATAWKRTSWNPPGPLSRPCTWTPAWRATPCSTTTPTSTRSCSRSPRSRTGWPCA